MEMVQYVLSMYTWYILCSTVGSLASSDWTLQRQPTPIGDHPYKTAPTRILVACLALVARPAAHHHPSFLHSAAPPEPHHHRIPIPPAISALCHSACPFRPAHHCARQAPTRLGACRLGSNHGADAKSDGRRSIGSVDERAKKLQRVHETQ